MRSWFFLSLLCFAAQGADLGGRVKVGGDWQDGGSQSLDEALGHKTSAETSAQLRLALAQSLGNWAFKAAWQLDGSQGSAVALAKDKAAAFPELAQGSDDSLWDLQQGWRAGHDSQYQQRWDRLNLGYSGQNLVMRLGRQALTWGAGQVFHPMDLVNPFQPVQLDTAYKRGTDLAYGQWLFDGGADLQVALVPHKNRDGFDADGGKPTQALFASIPGEKLQWTLLAASDRGDPTFGAGASGPFGENIWNLELVSTGLRQGGHARSLLFNLTRAGIIWQGDYTAFVEYYHNGFGQPRRHYSLAELAPSLAVRLRRGQQFVTARDYLALGGTWQWTPLVQLMPSLILNLKDASALFDTQLSWSLSDNLTFKADLRLPMGNKGTEFGGLPLLQDQAPYLTQPRQLQVQLELYF
ncbi:hypothetical protein PVT67_16545 [Gallaecimonas kandeliae]|uniref:hypothetical protein n=1 Tax=Gallaecimonas kandeliae TaxID=3029055 RepID=UPI002648666F|nr:hypothetical protein [Gallaecimonas kandeliae]WKE65252.1 hypothetical protein PVT67_16545 [Gallaecimonas kandeliae]